MKDWFMAGGVWMFSVLLAGIPGIVVGALAVRRPTPGLMAALRSLPTLIMVLAIHGFGSDMWAVNTHLSDEAFVKAMSISGDQLPFVALVGVTESAQVLTLGAFLAVVVVTLRLIADVRLYRAQGSGTASQAQ